MISENKLPNGWQLQPIPEVVFFQEGPGVRKHQYADSGVKLLNVGNINGGKIDLDATSRYVTEDEAYGRYKHFLVDDGDLLIGSSGITVDTFDKKIAFVGPEHLPLCMNTSTIRFKPLDRSTLDINYFKYFLGTSLFKGQLRRLITGTAQLNFGPSHLAQMVIPLPPLSEQKRIADILDKADAIRRKRQEATQSTRALVDSILATTLREQECVALTVAESPLSIIDGDRGKQYPKAADFSNDGYCLFLSAKNVTSQGFAFTTLQYISEDTDNALRKGKLQRGDVVLTTRGTIGNVAYYDDDVPFDHVRINSGMLILRPEKTKLSSSFLSLYLQSSLFQTEIDRLRSGTAQPQLPIRTLEHITLSVPDLSSQTECVRKVDAVRKSGKLLSAAASETALLFNSLVQRAFKGEL